MTKRKSNSEHELDGLIGKDPRLQEKPRRREQTRMPENRSMRDSGSVAGRLRRMRVDTEQLVREITENLTEVIWLGSSDWSQIFYVSPAYEGMTGETCESFLKKPTSWMDHIFPPDRLLVEVEFYRRIAAQDFETGGFPEFRIVKGDSPRWISIRAFPVRNKAGEVYRLAGIAEDITERKEAEQSRMAAYAVLDKTFQAIKDAVLLIDATSHVIVNCNSAVLELFGYSREDLIGRSPGILYPSAKAHVRFREKLLSGLESKAAFSAENRMKRKDGALFFAEHTVTEIADDEGHRSRVVAVIRDVTSRRETEKSLRLKTEALEEYNTTLKVLLRQQEEDKRELEQTMASNIRDLVMPYVLKLKHGRLEKRDTVNVSLIEAHLTEIISPFSEQMKLRDLTPRQMEIASLIKRGRTTKEIAELFAVTERAIEFHRNQIRKRLGLAGKKQNLQSYLRSATPLGNY
jgi:PAS domain S-box-containing protein